MSTEQALVKALQEWGFDRMESIHIVSVVRAALPEGTVLTRDGLAEVERVATYRVIEWSLDGLPIDSMVQWEDESEMLADEPLFSLTPERQNR